MLYSGDEKQHNNPQLAYVDAEFLRGGGRVTSTLATLLTDFVDRTDQLKDNVTLVFVTSESCIYRLKSKAAIGVLANGWEPLASDTPTANGKSAFSVGGAYVLKTSIDTHSASSANPHATTLEQARAANSQLGGNINANNNQIDNLGTPISDKQAATKAYADQVKTDSKAYADSLVVASIRIAGTLDASAGVFPTVGTSTAGAVRSGDQYVISVAGTIQGMSLDVDDTIYALINAPGQTASNWHASEHNVNQATESTRGTAMIVDAVTIANESSVEDTKLVTTKKLWVNFWQRVLALAWTWQQKQTFTLAPRFTSASASQYLKTDTNKDLTSVSTIPATDVSGLAAAVIASTLTGLAAATGTPVATDSILVAFNKVLYFINNIAPTTRAVVLTGIDLTTSATISATDTVLSAFGKLQAQVTATTTSVTGKLTGTLATDTETQITASVTEDSKFVSRLKLFNWWAFVKTQTQTWTARITFGTVLRLTSQTTAPPTVDGDIAYNGSAIKTQIGSVVTNFVTMDVNPGLTAASSRVMQAQADGTIVATNEFVDGNVADTDSDISSAITGATYNSANSFTASITPANSKVFYIGFEYISGAYLYKAKGDNIVSRIPLG